jgi:glutaminyl-tRNA synthetase
VRLYDRLFSVENPNEGDDFMRFLNPDALQVVHGAKLEPSLLNAPLSARYQFERLGYFCLDARDSAPGKLVWNRTIDLRDSWAKIEEKDKSPAATAGAPGSKGARR